MLVRFLFGLSVLAGFVLVIAWILWGLLKRSYDPSGLVFRWILTAGIFVGGGLWIAKLEDHAEGLEKMIGVFAAMILALGLVLLWGFPILGRIGEFVGSLYTGGSSPPEPQPLYSVAEARRKQGRYREAIWEIQAQLAKFPTDVVGQMMVAEIQAEHLDNLSGAQVTIERFCAQPGHGPKNIAFALNSLADWHLKYARDVEAAREAIQKIIDLVPDTESAMQAAQRLAHLADPEGIAAVLDRKPIQLRTGVAHVGLREAVDVRPAEVPPEETARKLVDHLQVHPLDAEAREKLAGIYSDHYGRLDLAVDQLEQLIEAPNQPAKEVARWLNHVADLQIRHGAEYDAIVATLQRIIEKFPGLSAEAMAQQRIEHLRLEMKRQNAGQRLELGTFERDLGLKKKPK